MCSVIHAKAFYSGFEVISSHVINLISYNSLGLNFSQIKTDFNSPIQQHQVSLNPDLTYYEM